MTAPPLNNNFSSELTQKMKDLELWHRQMGHTSTQTITETRKCTKGILKLPTNTPFFKCPFYEKAKMMKQSSNKSKDENVFIPGQVHHMDLAFVSGPSKLDNIRTISEESVTVKQSRDGYIGFLTIIDVAS